MELPLAQYRALVDAAPAMIRRVRLDGATDYLNEAWLELTGGAGWQTSVHPEDVERCEQRIRAHLDEGACFESTYRVRRHDGEYRWVLERGSPWVDESGAFAGLVAAAVDVHDLHEADAEKREILSKIGHDLRTPLQSLVLFAGEAKAVVESGSALRPKFAEGLERVVNRLRQLVERL